MRRGLLRLLFVLALAATVAMFAAGNGWGVVLGIAAAAIAGARAFRCYHPGPLGLLPPVTAEDGTRLPARWFCDVCGKEWPANFEREHKPVTRFEGYDESKATTAARRADELYRKQQALALRRAGVEVRRPRPERPVAEVVAIEPLRRAK